MAIKFTRLEPVLLSDQEARVLAYQFSAHVLEPHRAYHLTSGTVTVGCPTCELQKRLDAKLREVVSRLAE